MNNRFHKWLSGLRSACPSALSPYWRTLPLGRMQLLLAGTFLSASAAPSGATLLWAWFAAHLVHFASVAILFATFGRAHIAQHRSQTALVVLIGSSVVFGAASTIASHSRLRTVIHNALLYAVFGIFTLAFAHNQVVLLRFLAAALILALALRLTARFKPAESNLTSAG